MTENTRCLAGRRIVVTGAASGIGKAVAELFRQEGAALALLDLDGAGAEATLGEGEGLGIGLDITDAAEVEQSIDRAAEALGGIDGVVNAAGIMLTGKLLEMPAEAWRKQIDVNLNGTYLVIRACLPFLQRETGATVVNIASAQGLLPNAPGLSSYAASKGAVVALSRSLAAELAPGIRVNSVCPGLVDTPMGAPYLGNTGNYALGRPADPAEIARSILWLTGPEASYVTGAALAVDGGRSFH
ncbi:SDR family oxidoreductase [Salipiger bermudensis]|uniref:SDR family NAD(P)-dependent oxidoreductase n=1 Tax=Salipiger bermudensis TaxID=344736 RepID=UPI003008FAAE